MFTLCFAHLCAFLSCWDSSRLFYYALWVLTVITIALTLYVFLNDTYIDNFTTMLVVIGSGLLVLVGFIVFTEITIFKLILVFVPVVVFGIYLAYDVRTSVRNNIFDSEEEDPVSGAVRIWIETALVFCRLGEMVGKMFHKNSKERN